jgi:Ni/Co efflux regulator RcnB
MKRLFCAVAAIALMSPTANAAQSQNQDHRSNRSEQRQNRPAQQRPQTRPNRTAHPTQQRPQTRPTRRTAQRPTNRPSKPSRPTRPTNPSNRPSRPSTQPVARPLPVYHPGRRPSTYHRVRAPSFRYPHGYRYRRWSVGLILPRLFLSNSYYWNDWGALGLGPPPPGYVWVRYGPDLLLVSRYTGRVADVIYGAFY